MPKHPDYLKLCAILETTQARKADRQQYAPGIAVIEGKQYLRIRDGRGVVVADTRCDLPDGLDGAAKRVARKLTLDGALPNGMNGD